MCIHIYILYIISFSSLPPNSDIPGAPCVMAAGRGRLRQVSADGDGDVVDIVDVVEAAAACRRLGRFHGDFMGISWGFISSLYGMIVFNDIDIDPFFWVDEFMVDLFIILMSYVLSHILTFYKVFFLAVDLAFYPTFYFTFHLPLYVALSWHSI